MGADIANDGPGETAGTTTIDAWQWTNAAFEAFGHQYENDILDTGIVFGPLIDAVMAVSRGQNVAGPDARTWARRFIAENAARIDEIAPLLEGKSGPAAHELAHRFRVRPLPMRVTRHAERRAAYDTTVIDGLGKFGLAVDDVLHPKDRTFTSVWTGRDGGRLEVQEYKGLPLRVIAIDSDKDDAKATGLTIRAVNDAVRDAEAVVAAAKELWG